MAKKDNILLGVFDCQTLSKRFTDAVKLNDFIIAQSRWSFDLTTLLLFKSDKYEVLMKILKIKLKKKACKIIQWL